VSIDFPFVDRLSEGRTPFRYVPAMLITSTAQVALEASAAYGTVTYPSAFSPDCNAYDFLPGSDTTTTYANATSLVAEDGTAASINATFTRGRGAPSPPRAFFEAAANQPSFANGSSCDAMARLFDTASPDGADRVAARVVARLGPVFGASGAREMVWTDAPGWQVDSAFLESQPVPCEELQDVAGPSSKTSLREGRRPQR
jgi:hypothetical protein